MKRKLLTLALTIFLLAVFPAFVLAGSAILHWQPNTDPDLGGYRIYYGTSSRSYGPYIPVGKDVTSYTLNGLVEGNTYYFALTAVDTSGNESGYSVEVSKTIGEEQTASSPVEAFVTRFYKESLGRQPDGPGLSSWVDALKNGSISGADVARGFILSGEFKNRNTTNEQFLTVLYMALLNRVPDQVGYSYWLDQLNGGRTREYILNNFINSSEFAYVCHESSVKPYAGTYNLMAQASAFVTRFYRECLGRQPDSAGLSAWVNALSNGYITCADVARGFITSQEFKAKNTANSQFITILYKAILGRAPDAAGYDHWLVQLNNGRSRDDILNSFIGSSEFADNCRSYGLSAF